MKKLLALLLIVCGMQGLMVQANHSYKYLEMLSKDPLSKDSMLKDKCRWCLKGGVIGYDVENNCILLNTILEKIDHTKEISIDDLVQKDLAIRKIMGEEEPEDEDQASEEFLRSEEHTSELQSR